jgi:structural maintenance of chromosome 2
LERDHKTFFGEHKKAEDALTSNEELLQSLLTGLGASSGAGGGGYLGQLADARARLAQAQAEEEQGNVKLAMVKKELKALEAKWKEVEREAGEGRGNLERKRKEVETLRVKVEKSGWSAEKEKKLEEQLRQARLEERRLREVWFLLLYSRIIRKCLIIRMSRNETMFVSEWEISTSATRHPTKGSTTPE